MLSWSDMKIISASVWSVDYPQVGRAQWRVEESGLTLTISFLYSQITPLEEKGANVVIGCKAHWVQETVDLEDCHFWALSDLCNMMEKDGLSCLLVLIYCDAMAHFKSLGQSCH